MAADRLEVRLDPARRRKLEEIARARGVAVSEVVRDMIDHFYAQARQDQRQRAAQQLAQLEIEDVPEPEVLSQQFASAYGVADLP